jgi:cystathionine beta-lyase/cystathionine gamma-synthase
VLGPERLRNVLFMYRKDFGGVLSPKPAWDFLVHGLPTLATRMEAAQRTAFRVASWLEAHPKIERVAYPGLESFNQGELARRQLTTVRGEFAPGLMIYFELKDPARDGSAGARMIDWIAENAYAITLAVSLGQVKTLIEHPFSMTHSALPDEEKRHSGVHPGGIRLSIGLEDADDLIADLAEGLERA